MPNPEDSVTPHTLLSGFVLATIPAAPALSTELDRSHVPADARWVMHLDVAAMTGTKLVETALETRTDLEIEVDDGREVDLADVLSLTAFGPHPNEEPAALLLHLTDAGAERILNDLRAEDGYLSLDANGHKLHAYAEGDQIEAYAWEKDVDVGRLFVVSERRKALMNTILVVEGDAPSLADAEEPHLAATPNAGSFFYLEANGEMPAAGGEASELVRAMTIDVGETNGELTIDVEALTDGSDDSRDLVQIGRGALALGQLLLRQSAPESDCAALLSSLSLTAEGQTVSAHFRHDSQRLVELLESLED